MLDGSNLLKFESAPNPSNNSSETQIPAITRSDSINSDWLGKIYANRDTMSLLMKSIMEKESTRKMPSDPHVVELDRSDKMIQSVKRPAKAFLNLFRTSPKDRNSLPVSPESTTTQSLVDDLISTKFREAGYEELTSFLESRQGFPWDLIRQQPNPELAHQLREIYQICSETVFIANPDATKLVIDFAIEIAAHPFRFHLDTVQMIEDAKSLLGKFIFLLDRTPQALLYAIKSGSQVEKIQNIKAEFSEFMASVCHDLSRYYLDHKQAGLQSHELALHTRIPQEIAKLLLTKRGTINWGIIELIARIFIDQENLRAHQIQLSYGLGMLKKSIKLRNEIENITGPKDPKASINEVIRASLILSDQEIIGANEARLTALMAVLSCLSQEGEASCFATSLVRELLASHLIFSLKDFKELLNESKLTRANRGIRRQIPYVKRMYDSNLDKTIVVTSKGFFRTEESEEGVPLWEAPGLMAVCRTIGFSDCQSAIQSLLKKLPFIKGKNLDFTVKFIIKKLCQEAVETSLSSKKLSDLISQSLFVFSSLTAQPLLKVWTNAIANLAESEESGVLKKATIRSIELTLASALERERVKVSPIIDYFFRTLKQQLFHGIGYQFDPTMQRDVRSSNSVSGGFSLFYREKQIDSPDGFCHFLEAVILHSAESVAENLVNSEERNELSEFVKILVQFFRTPTCLNEIVCRYHPSNHEKYSADLLEGPLPYDNLLFTPWKSAIGNDSKVVLMNYLESHQPIPVDTVIFNNAQEVLKYLIDKGKTLPNQQKVLIQSNPFILFPLCLPGKHRMSLIPGHPSLQAACHSLQSAEEWIEENMIIPGKQISEKLVTHRMKNRMMKLFSEGLLARSVSEERLSFLLKAFELQNLKTVQETRADLMNIYSQILQNEESNIGRDKFSQTIDFAIYLSLDFELKRKLEKSAVHIADTNWVDGANTIHLCIVMNPGTGKLELWEVFSDRTHLSPLDQKDWIEQQKWEFLNIPDNLLPPD